MDDAPTPAPLPTPGEVRPAAARTLDRPPSDRYAPPAKPTEPVSASVDLAVFGGILASIAGAALWLLAGGILDLGGGLVVVAVVTGWLIGGAMAYGAWRGRPHLGASGIPRLAILLGLLTWLAGTALLYLYAEITLPESSLSLADRLASTPFLDWLAPQFLPLGPLEILLIAGVSWWSAR